MWLQTYFVPYIMKSNAQLAYQDAQSTWKNHEVNQNSYSSSLESSKYTQYSVNQNIKTYRGHANSYHVQAY